MGAESSKECIVKIQLDKHESTPGEAIRGSINIFVSKTLPPSRIELTFKGVEKVKWTQYIHKGSSDGIFARLKNSEKKAVLYKNTFTIFSWDSPVQSGSYCVPFCFTVPEGLLGSIELLVDTVIVSIVYKVQVRVCNEFSVIKDKQEVNLISIFPQHKPDETIFKHFMKSYCGGTGNILFHCNWISDLYSFEMPIQFLLNVDCSLAQFNLKSITARIYCSIELEPEFGDKRIFGVEILDYNINMPVSKGQNAKMDTPCKILLDEALKSLNAQTTNATLFKSNFFIEFELKMDKGCMCSGENPIFIYKFYVCHQPFVKVEKIESPPNWYPHIYNPVIINPNNSDDLQILYNIQDIPQHGYDGSG